MVESNLKQLGQELAEYRICDEHDIFVVPKFAQETLEFDPCAMQDALENCYPVRGRGDVIVPGQVQWVDGDNKALHYRGNELKRGKIWLQKDDPFEFGFLRYYYTGTHADWAIPLRSLSMMPLLCPLPRPTC
tara:strand:- start:59 stop:454 length:396 start_codon:yes stop_codon:yes gene_type:complete